jgi:hypothetical protein
MILDKHGGVNGREHISSFCNKLGSRGVQRAAMYEKDEDL